MLRNKVFPEELAWRWAELVPLDLGDKRPTPNWVVEAAIGLKAIVRKVEMVLVVGLSMLEDVRHG